MKVKTNQKKDLLRDIVKEAISTAYKIMHGGKSIKAPQVLWHYTNAQALKQIVESKRIFASHYDYLNDPSEGILFTEIAHEIAEERLKNLPTLSDADELKTRADFRTVFWRVILTLDNLFVNIPVCVACFSASGDLLSQWRSYGDNCNGYALGISTKWLLNQTISPAFPFRLIRVIYDPKQQRKLVASLLDCIIDRASIAMSITLDDDAQIKLVDMWVSLLKGVSAEYSTAIKQPAYADEREWRLVTFGHKVKESLAETNNINSSYEESIYSEIIEKFKFRISQGNFIPYLNINLTDDEGQHSFRKIRLGPMNDYSVESFVLSKFLESFDLNRDMEISESEIRVRNK